MKSLLSTLGKRDGDKDYFLHQPFFPEAQADTCEVTTPSRDMLVGMNEVSFVLMLEQQLLL